MLSFCPVTLEVEMALDQLGGLHFHKGTKLSGIFSVVEWLKQQCGG